MKREYLGEMIKVTDEEEEEKQQQNKKQETGTW